MNLSSIRQIVGRLSSLFLACLYGSLGTKAFAVTLNSGDMLVADPDFVHAAMPPNFEAIYTAIWKIDPNGARELVTGRGTGAGVPLLTATQVVVDSHGRIIVADNYGSALLNVDPTTGDRSYLSSLTVGAGLSYQAISAIALDHDDSFVVLDHLSHNVFRVDETSGDRTLISGPSRGQGPEISFAEALAVDPQGFIWTASNDPSGATLLQIDPITGDRQLVSGLGVGAGQAFSGDISDIQIIDDHLAMVLNLGRLCQVDLVTGDRVFITTQGPQIQTLFALARLPDGTFMAPDEATGNIFHIDLVAGVHTLFSQNTPGHELWMPQDIFVIVPEPSFAFHIAVMFLIGPIFRRRRR